MLTTDRGIKEPTRQSPVYRLDSIGLEYIRRYKNTSDRVQIVKHVKVARPADLFH